VNPRRLAILTGGGDVPGLNSVIRSVVLEAEPMGCEVIGIRRGWLGLVQMQPGRQPDGRWAVRLDRDNTHGIDRSGGTILHTSRTNPARVARAALPAHLEAGRVQGLEVEPGIYDLTPVVLENLEALDCQALLVVGGDDTLGYAQVLAARGFPLVGIPKTMDNDVAGTEYCIGFSTAITRARELINRQRTTLASHERIGVFRIFGRDAGFTALYAAGVTFGRCVIPEAPFDLDHLAALLLEDKRRNPSSYAFVIASEGAAWKGYRPDAVGEPDAYGHRRKADIGIALAEALQRSTGEEVIASNLTYDLRSGEADMLDQLVAVTFAGLAMDMVREGQFGCMTAVVGGRYACAPLPPAGAGTRRLDVARLYDVAGLCPRYSGRLGLPLLLGDVSGL